VGDENVLGSVERRDPDIAHHGDGRVRAKPPTITGAPERAAQVAAEQPERRRFDTSHAGSGDDRSRLGVGRHLDAVVGQRGDNTPRLTLADRHR
jgi:hypothetical protein